MRLDYLVDVTFATPTAARQLLTLVVTVPNTSPVFAPAAGLSQSVTIGRVVVPFASSFSDSEGDAVTFALAPLDLGDGLATQPSSLFSLDSLTGRLTVTTIAGDQGNHTVNITCSDSFGGTGYAVVNITVNNRPPAVAQV